MKLSSEIITSRSNTLVKWCASLQEKKGRNEAECFFVEGEKLSFEALDALLPAKYILVLDEKKDKIFPLLNKYKDNPAFSDTTVLTVSSSVFSKISTEKSPQGIITVIKYLDFFKELDIIYKEDFCILPSERAIILSSVRDPGNLGSVIRSAVAFGVDHIVLSHDSADIYNPKTIRSAMGSLYRVKVTTVKSLPDFIRVMRECGRRVFAAELSENASELSEIGLLKSDAIVIGNEGHGISPDVSSVCDGSVYIPISKNTESLNASVAAAIFMWEQSRKE